MDKMMRRIGGALAAMLCVASGAAAAQGAVKIGVVAEFSGPFADYGTQILGGMKREETLVVTGSLYLVGEALAEAREKQDILCGLGAR